VKEAQNQKIDDQEKTFSPAEVRKLLNTDSCEIQRLCKEISVFPKKDNSTGRIFFFKSDVEVLKKVKELYGKSQNIQDAVNKAEMSIPSKVQSTAVTNPINMNALSGEIKHNNIIDSVNEAQENIVRKLTGIIEEKLEGLDDVVVELIRSKVENEKLRAKLDQATKENHKLIIDLNKYKSVGFGLYKKNRKEEI
jgi:hypothetical protein